MGWRMDIYKGWRRKTLDDRGLPGTGASVWYPCKDHQGDEPDNGASLVSLLLVH